MRRLDEATVRRVIREQLSGTVPGKRRAKSMPSLVSVLFEADGATGMAQELGLKPITLVLFYGPPAAGKGEAQKDAPKFAGIDSKEDYKKFIEDATTGGAFVQEEDARMVKFTTGSLPRSVFKSLFDRVEAGERFESIVDEYFHVNESDKKFELKKILSPGAFKKMFDMGREEGAEYFASFPNTKAYFTQARGFTNPGRGLPDLPDDAISMLGPNDGSMTVGARLMAAEKYMSDVKDEMRSIIKGSVQSDSPYATIYLADQAGESTANVGRIAEVGKLKGDSEFSGLKIIGIYIHQPSERTRITNLHRAATGGRRVAQDEVNRIFDAAPKIEGGKIVEKGPAIEAMEAAGFDQIHVYYPPNPFDPETSKAEDGRSVEDAICEPFGDGTGALDIEGCEDSGNATSAKSLYGLEQFAIKKAEIDVKDPSKGIPEELSDEDKKKIVSALGEMGFRVSEDQLLNYLKKVQAPGIRGGGNRGITPWSKALFDKSDGRDPTEKITVKEGKSSSNAANRNSSDPMLERWQRLAGLIK